MNILLNVISTVGAFIAIGACLDQFLKSEHKRRVAAYIFGNRKVSFADFETSFVRMVLSPFFLDGKIRTFRLLAASFVISLATLIIGAALVFEELVLVLLWQTLTEDPNLSSMIVAFALGVSIASHPLDRFSLRVSEFFFVKKSPEFPNSWLAIAADSLLSSIPPLIITIVSVEFNLGAGVPGLSYEFLGVSPGILLAYGAMLALWGMLVLGILQITGALVGTLMRMLTIFSGLSLRVAAVSKAREYPLTYMSAVTALLFLLLDAVLSQIR